MPRQPRRPLRRLLAACCVLAALSGAACSGDDDAGGSDGTTTTEAAALTRCEVHKALETMNQLPAPTTPEEGRESVAFITAVYSQVSDDAPPERASEAAVLDAAMDQLRAEAEAAGYGGSFLAGPPEALQSREFTLASEIFRDDYADACGTGPTTTVVDPSAPTSTGG